MPIHSRQGNGGYIFISKVHGQGCILQYSTFLLHAYIGACPISISFQFSLFQLLKCESTFFSLCILCETTQPIYCRKHPLIPLPWTQLTKILTNKPWENFPKQSTAGQHLFYVIGWTWWYTHSRIYHRCCPQAWSLELFIGMWLRQCFLCHT